MAEGGDKYGESARDSWDRNFSIRSSHSAERNSQHSNSGNPDESISCKVFLDKHHHHDGNGLDTDDTATSQTKMSQSDGDIKTERYFHVQKPVWELLALQETKKFIDRALKDAEICCEWKLAEGFQVVVYSKQKTILSQAARRITESVPIKTYKAEECPFITRIKDKRHFQLNEEEYSRFILKAEGSVLKIVATADVMSKINKQVSDMEKQHNAHNDCSHSKERDTLPKGNMPMSVKLPVHGAEVTHSVKLSELQMCFVKELKILEKVSKCSWKIDAENCQVVISAKQDDAISIDKRIKELCTEVEKSKQSAHLPYDCLMLFEKESMKTYVEDRLRQEDLLCYWTIEKDELYVYALNVENAKKAATTICLMVSAHSVGETDYKYQEVQKLLQKYNEEAILLSDDTDDPCLVVREDVEREILDVIKHCRQTHTGSTLTECVASSEERIRFFLTKHEAFIQKMQQDHKVIVHKSADKNHLIITGKKKSVTKAKDNIQKYMENISEQELKYLPEMLKDGAKKTKFEQMNNCQISVKEGSFRPRPSYVWLEKSVHLMLVLGDIADSDADVIVCPLDKNMKPMATGENIFRKAGNGPKEHLYSHKEEDTKLDPYLSDETGDLHCPYIMYAMFPSTDDRGSAMSISSTVVTHSIQKIFKKANSQEFNSLAMDLHLSNLISTPTWMNTVADYLKANIGSTKCLKQIYLYCLDESELNNAKSIFGQALGPGFDFSAIVKDQASRPHPSCITVEIMRGSLIDQRVDVLVNSTSYNLDLSRGYVSSAILNKAGSEIQQECKESYKGGIRCGGVAVTTAGQFEHVKNIFHVVLPHWIPTADFSLMVLELLVNTCLRYMDTKGLESIAFPALGIGNWEYPIHLVAKTMFDTVKRYGRRHSSTKIKKVMMVFMEDEVAKVFENLHKYPSLGYIQRKESARPCQQILEARMLKTETSIRIQILPFHECLWQTQALVEFYSVEDCQNGKQMQNLRENGFDMKWITQSSGYYLLMRVLTDAKSFKKDVQKTLTKALEERITSVGFCVTNEQEKLSYKEQTDMIRDVLSDDVTNKYLQEVKILLTKEEYDKWLKQKKRERTRVERTTAYFKQLVGRKPSVRVTKYIRQVDAGMNVTVVAEKHSIDEVLRKLEPQNIPEKRRTSISESPAASSVTNSDDSNVGQGARPKKSKQPTDVVDIHDSGLMDLQVFEKVEAVVNPWIERNIQNWDKVVERHGAVYQNGQIVCKDLSSLQNVDVEFQTKSSQNVIKVKDTFKHFSSPQDDYVLVPDINISMSEEDFLAIQFFCRGEKALDQQAVSYRNGMLQITCNDSSDKKVVQACIESKLEHIEIMNKDDVSFTSAEEPKIKGIIKQIHDTVDGVFCYQLRKDEHSMVHLMAFSYGQLQTTRHKIALGLGRIKQTETRRNRRFGMTPLQPGGSTLTDKSRLSQSYREIQSPWKPQTTAGYGSISSKDFTTPEGLLVRVYPGSILHLDVDCIVNAANGDLKHGGGVAQVISNAAGYKFDKESRDYIYKNGPLGVGQVCTTTAGNLRYRGVIHAVGPRWNDYNQDQKWICLSNLKTAVKNSLEEADFQGYRSIAIPTISSGIFGVPKELCTQEYYRAVEEYSRSRGRDSTLTEVHFIDKDTQMCQLIQTTFTKYFTGNVGSGSQGADTGGRRNSSSSVRITRNTSSDLQRSKSVDPTGPPFTDQHRNFQHSAPSCKRFEYQIGNNLTVHIIHGNIVKIEADAIVSPENVQCDSSGSIAREIARVAGRGYVDNDQSELRIARRKPKMTEVLDTLAGHSQFKYVLHVVAPEWDIAAFEDQPAYYENLKKSYKNILSLPDENHLDIGSLAFPVLGTGK